MEEDKIGLLVDKYRPTSLDQLDFAHDVSNVLKSLCTKDIPHLIIEGCRGSGKKLRVMLFLLEKFGSFNVKTLTLSIDVLGKTEKKDIHMMVSPFHYQINPSTHSFYDRSLMQVFTTEVIKYKILDGVPYRILVIEDADLLTIEAQESLRRTLETYIKTCRFIFLVNREDKIIAPLYSRCVLIKVPSPTEQELITVLQRVSKEEGAKISIKILTDIAYASDRNITLSLHYLERYLMGRVKNGVEFKKTDYDSVYYISNMIWNQIVTGVDMDEALNKIRDLIYELVTYCVDCRAVIPVLLSLSLDKLPKTESEHIYRLCKVASERDTSIRISSKPIYHVESFCLHLFNIVKQIMSERKKTKD